MKSLILSLLILFCHSISAQNYKVHLVFLGNSITEGTDIPNSKDRAEPVPACCNYLKSMKGIKELTYSNQGVSGSTTVDFLPISETRFPNVIKAANQATKDQQLIFSIMLGTNDSASKGPNGSPVSPQQYYTNMKVIIDELISLYPSCKVVIHRPIWYSPNTHNGAVYLKDGLDRLNSYYPMITKLITYYNTKVPNKVSLGDTDAYNHFIDNKTDFKDENGFAGVFHLHPNKKGAENLGKYWAQAIYRVVDRK